MSIPAMNSNIETLIKPEILQRVKNLNHNLPHFKEIDSLLKKTVLRGGKKIRPLLTFLMGDLFRISLDEMESFASFIELIHAASLSHDDVIDSATQRRGAPSINVLSSNKKAVLAGDYLFASVIMDLAKKNNPKLVEEIALVIQSLSKGEWLQLSLSANRNYTRENIKDIANLKTSSVLSWSCIAPAILTNQSQEIISHCRSFGSHLGIAFQQTDDILDFSGTSQKDQYIDIKNGIINSVLFEWFERNPSIKKKFQNSEDISHLIKDKQDELPEVFKIVRNHIQNHLNKAQFHLNAICDELLSKEETQTSKSLIKSALIPIESFIHFLKERSL